MREGLLRGLTLHILHPADRLLHTLLHVLKGHARNDRDFALCELVDGLTDHRYLGRIRQVEDSNEGSLSVLTDT